MPQLVRAAVRPAAKGAVALRKFYSQIANVRDLGRLSSALIAGLTEALSVAPVALFLPDTQHGGYQLAAGAGLPPDLAEGAHLAADAVPPAFRAAPDLVEDAGPRRAVQRLRPSSSLGLGSFTPVVAVPLAGGSPETRAGGGLVLIAARPAGPALGRADLELLALLGDAAATALREAALAEEHARSLQQLQTLHRLGEELSANLDVEAVCQTVYEQLRGVIEFDSFFIARYDEERKLLVFPFCTDEGRRYVLEPQPLGGGLTTWIFEQQRPLVIEDLSQGVEQLHLEYRPDKFGSYRGSRSWMGVPMLAKHRAIGVLSIHAYRPGLYRQEQVQFLSTVANQVASALENARLLTQTDTALAARVAQLSALEEIARLLNASQDLERIINLVIARAVETTGAAAGIMALFDPAIQALRLLGRVGYPPEVLGEYGDRPLPITRGIIGRAVREDHSLLVRDVERDPDYIEVLPGVQAQLVVLVRRGGQVIGALSVESRDADGFSEEHRDFIEHLAEHAAIAVENVRRYDRERRQIEALTRRTGELAAILRISNALKADATLDEVLRQVVEGVRSSLGFRVAIVSLIEEGPPRRFVRVAAAGVDPQTWEDLKARRPSVEEGNQLMNPRFQVSQSYFISHLYNMVTHLESYFRPELDERSDNEWHPDDMLLVPLRSKSGELVGTLSVDDPVDRQLPSRTTIETLEIFANQASVAIENARLFQDQRRRLRDMTSLQSLGLSLTATLDISTLLEEAARLAVQLLDARSSGVLLIDSGDDVMNMRCWRRDGGRLEFARYNSTVRPGGLTDSVRRTGEPLMIMDAASDSRINPITLAEGIRSLVAVPIRAADQILGVLFVNEEQPRAFAAHEQQLLQIFANQVAVAINNARLFEERHAFERRLLADNERMGRELVTARATQRQLLPEMPRRLAGLAIHGLCLPAMEVGGDYFDVLPLPDGRLALAIGDVTGKGTSAVMLMAMIKTAVHSQVSADPDPAAVIQALNLLAIEFMQGQLMTFFYALYDPATRCLTYSNAGHLFPYVRRPDGTLDNLMDGSLPLGADLRLDTPVSTATLAPGDLLVMFSDGIVEAQDAHGTLFSFGRLEALLEEATAVTDPRLLVEDLVDRVHAFAGGHPQDDATLLIAVVE